MLWCCTKFPNLVIPVGAVNRADTIIYLTINVYAYIFESCKVNGKHPFEDKSTCPLCPILPTTETSTKLYTQN